MEERGKQGRNGKGRTRTAAAGLGSQCCGQSKVDGACTGLGPENGRSVEAEASRLDDGLDGVDAETSPDRR